MPYGARFVIPYIESINHQVILDHLLDRCPVEEEETDDVATVLMHYDRAI